jgi:hypothetical protein
VIPTRPLAPAALGRESARGGLALPPGVGLDSCRREGGSEEVMQAATDHRRVMTGGRSKQHKQGPVRHQRPLTPSGVYS